MIGLFMKYSIKMVIQFVVILLKRQESFKCFFWSNIRVFAYYLAESLKLTSCITNTVAIYFVHLDLSFMWLVSQLHSELIACGNIHIWMNKEFKVCIRRYIQYDSIHWNRSNMIRKREFSLKKTSMENIHSLCLMSNWNEFQLQSLWNLLFTFTKVK